MNRARTLLAAVTLALVMGAAAGAGPALADDPAGSVAGQGAVTARGSYDPAEDPAVPYIVALLVTSAGLMLVGLVALQRPRAGLRRRAARSDRWTCGTCGMGNPPEHATCFSCRAPRDGASAPADSAAGSAAYAPDPTAGGYSA